VRARAVKSPQKGRLVLWLALVAAGLTSRPTLAANSDALTRNNFGGIGMIDMPSARMAHDGELSAGASFLQNTQHYNLGFQILPWLETSFRYSGLSHFDPAFPVYYDRSFAAKIRLFQETPLTPAVALGVNDLVGTGLYGGEYLVASKQFGNFDTTIGLGWGRLGSTDATRNPLSSLSKSFDRRVTFSGAGGLNFNLLFHGQDVGLFGGIVWHTPIKGLAAIVEYSSDAYAAENTTGNFAARSQVNFGINYQVDDSVTLGLNYLYGRSLGGSISFQLNPLEPQYPAKIGTPPPQVAVRSVKEQQVGIQTLMHQGRGSQPPLRRASMNRANFADAIWQQKDIRDVQISGRSLLLTVSSDAGRQCIFIAKLAQTYGSDIRTIVVEGPGQSQPVQCVTASADAPAYMNIVRPTSPTFNSMGAPDLGPIEIINAVETDPISVMQNIRANARKQKITIEALSLSDGIATVYYSNSHYFKEYDAIDRLTRVLMNDAPSTVEKFRLIAVVDGIPQREIDILRAPEERLYSQTGTLSFLGDSAGATVGSAPMQNPILTAAQHKSYPRFSWDIFPQLRQELFDPANPFAIQLTAAADASIEILPGLSAIGEVESSLFDNFNVNRQSESALPHVRSDFLKYFSQGKTGIGQLDTEYRFRLAPTISANAKIGYLESMFAGGGGEILWRPEGQRWALGADAYEVWQRGYDRLLDLQRYHTFTGHVSLYYASPWHDLNFMLSAGQYLAGDRGLTFQITRRFSAGVEIGAFFTKTNVSSQQFGEGSFDKGIIIRIPLDWALPIETQGQWNIDLRPVQRDGGQFLQNAATLYGETNRTSDTLIRENFSN